MNLSQVTSEVRQAVAYLSGVEAASKLSPEERSQHTIQQMVRALECLTEAVEECQRRQTELEARLDHLNRGADNAAHESGGPVSGDPSRTLCCPHCRKQLPITNELWEQERFEIACPYCALAVEVR